MECGEGKRKEGEEIVLCVCCYWTEAKSDREKHSVFFDTHPTRSPPFPTLLNTTTRVLFTGHRQLGRCSGLGRAVWGGACK